MTGEILIRNYRESDFDDVMEIYEEAFKNIDGPNYYTFLPEYQKDFDMQTIVADFNGVAVGFDIWRPCWQDCPETAGKPLTGVIGEILDLARDPGSEDALRRKIAKADTVAGSGKGVVEMEYLDDKPFTVDLSDTVVEYYDNHFTNSRNIAIQDEDFCITAIAVHSDFRGRGISKMMTERQLAIARDDDASAVYVFCVGSSASPHLYRSFDFTDIFKYGPSYLDGSATEFLGKLLE